MKAGYILSLAAHCSAAPQAPQLLQGSLLQNPQLGATQPHALQPYQQAVPQHSIMPQESDDISCAQGQGASPVLAKQMSRNSACGLNVSAPGKAEESDPDFARLGGPGPSGGVSAGQAQGRCAGASSAANAPLQDRIVGPMAIAGSGMQGTPGSATAGAAASSGSRPTGHVGAHMASNKSVESDKENAAASNAACHHIIKLMS